VQLFQAKTNNIVGNAILGDLEANRGMGPTSSSKVPHLKSPTLVCPHATFMELR